MPVKFQVKQNSVLKAKRNMRKLQKQIPDLTRSHKQIAVFLRKWVLTNFKEEGRPVGGWLPFKAGGRRGDSDAKLLVDTGILRNSFNEFFSRKNAGVGSELDYAKKHDEGDPTINLPQRRILPKESEVVSDIEKIYENELRSKIRKFS